MKTTYLLLLTLPLWYACTTDTQAELIITNVHIIDIETGLVRNHQDVLIKDSMIVSIEPAKGRKNRTIIDGTDHFLIPGLWDMHVHLQDSSYLAMNLDFGIIGVRDMGGCVTIPTDGCESLCPDQLNRWKKAINKGTMHGPHLFFAGPTLSGTGWPTSLPVLTKEEVALAFQTNLQNEVDFIKVYEQIPADAYQEIARLADLHQLDFAGHTSESMLLSNISDLGQKSIEHLREPILLCFTDDLKELEAFMQEDGYTAEDRAFVRPWVEDADDAIEAFRRNGTWFTPTMAVQYARQRYTDTTWMQHPLRDRMPASVNNGMQAHLQRMQSNTDTKGDALWWMAHKKLVKRLSQEGIGLLAGSDAACEGGLPGYTLHEELQLMVEAAGLSPREALQTATLNPCLYFGFANRGNVQESYYADLVLLSANPLEDIRNTRLIKAVIKNGLVERLN